MRTGTPLTGLLSLDMTRAPSRWDKFDLLHDALRTSADSQPVRSSHGLPHTAVNSTRHVLQQTVLKNVIAQRLRGRSQIMPAYSCSRE